MFIINDLGSEVLNADNVFSFGVLQAPDGNSILMAFAPALAQAGPLQTALVIGTKDRCQRALKCITDGLKQRQHIVDLVGILGQRPDITVPQQKIVLPGNGEGRP
jgi:hypothetical protein